MSQIQHQLARVISQQTVFETALGILRDPESLSVEERDMAEAARDACIAVSRHAFKAANEVQEIAKAKGIELQLETPLQQTQDLQFSQIIMRCDKDNLRNAIQSAIEAGFEPQMPISAGRLAAIQNTQSSVRLIRFDAQTTRLVIAFDTPKPSSGLGKLRPSAQEFAMVDLPAPLWRLYYLMKPVRLALQKLRLRRDPNNENDFLGTPNELIVPIFEALGAGVDDVVFDIGAGDGRIVTTAAKEIGCRAVGVEKNPALVALARQSILDANLSDKATIIEADALDADLSQATIVFLFMPAFILKSVLPAIRAKLSTGARIVVHEQSDLSHILGDVPPRPVFGDASMTNVYQITV